MISVARRDEYERQVSTLAQPAKRFTPGCYSLLYDWLLPKEVFNREVTKIKRSSY